MVENLIMVDEATKSNNDILASHTRGQNTSESLEGLSYLIRVVSQKRKRRKPRQTAASVKLEKEA